LTAAETCLTIGKTVSLGGAAIADVELIITLNASTDAVLALMSEKNCTIVRLLESDLTIKSPHARY
jgi:hypothetical protein